VSARRPALLLAAAATLCLAAAGCGDPCASRIQPLQDKIVEQEDRIDELAEANRRLEQDIVAQQELIRRLRGLGDKRMEHVFTVQSVELGDYTTGVNLDDEPGDDGVRVRLVPIDAAGTPIKASGDVVIQLYDLADEDSPLVARCTYGVEGISQYWSSHFGTYHFRFECPFERTPRNEAITVRVTFTDYLTGNVVHDQKQISIDLPADEQ
jgi:hypothetical protein